MAQDDGQVKDPLPTTAAKAAWRRWARARMAHCGCARCSAAVVAGVASWLARQAPTTVLAYRAMAGEVSLETLVAADRRHRWATTRTPPEGELTLHPWAGPDEEHRYGFRQPVAGAALVPAGEVGVVLVPGLLFDRSGGRLGHGRGYYDRLLAHLGAAVAVGVTCEAFVIDAVPVDGGDVPVSWLATESGVVRTVR